MADKNVLYRIVAATDGRLRTMETSIKKINSWIKKIVRHWVRVVRTTRYELGSVCTSGYEIRGVRTTGYKRFLIILGV